MKLAPAPAGRDAKLAGMSRRSLLILAALPSVDAARQLDRLADAELQHGHVAAAERLAHRAQHLRETGA